MRHAGVQYLIVRNVNLLNHCGQNDWIHVSKRVLSLLACMRGYTSQTFVPRLLSASESRLTMLAGLNYASFMQGMWLAIRGSFRSFRSWLRSHDMICMCDVIARAPHVPIYI